METSMVKQVSEELGTLAKELQPIAQSVWENALKQSYVIGWGSLGVMLFVGLVGGVCITLLLQRIKKQREENTWNECILEWVAIIGISICIATTIGVGVFNIFQLINPEWYAIHRILHISQLK